jgi:neutral ceramidase
MRHPRHAPWAVTAVLVLAGVAPRCPAQPVDAPWKAGVATATITPDGPIWMAGYAARTKPSDGKIHDLSAKALALEDAAGGRLVVVTMDLIGITRAVRDAVEKEVRDKHGLPPAALLLNASHTHSGPVVRSGGSVMYDLPPGQGERIDRYVAGLRDTLVALVGKALADLKPARLGYSHARCGFAMNRRLLTERGYQINANPDGPVDHAVPVLRVDAADGKLRAILFGYACHNTTLGQDFYRICGDYAGFAQLDLEAAHPGAVALFVTGCGGDQNPYPRGIVELARQHGRALATAVEAALLPKAKPVRGPLRVALEDVTLDFVPAGRDELLKLKESKDASERRRAQALLDEMEKAGRLNSTYAYPVQVVQFGGDLTLVGLSGEVVVDYSHRLKRELTGPPLWVAAYCNDVFGYVPSRRVLEEGGYEGGGAMRYTRFPGPFAPSVEERVVGKVHELVKRVRATDGAGGR